MAMRAPIVFTLALLAGSAAAINATTVRADDLYQWKDSKGVTHYSDAPPPKGQFKSRTVHVREGIVAPPASEPAKTTTAADANCTLAQANLKRLQAGGDLGPDANGDGKPDSTFNAQQLAEQTQLAQKNIQSWCARAAKPAP